ncbi:MAG TPA: hypothetical protein VK986_27625 [Tepidisphaeraceae bacterium]|nr:hypothetical protein [Tepidisphaeraceae bacterium]
MTIVDDDKHPIPERKHCRRINVAGHVHYLTFSCYRRRPFLSRDRSRQWFIDAVCTAREKHPFDLWAYVIMPEHAHLLLLPLADTYEIGDILSAIKLPVARRAAAFVRREAPESRSAMADIAMDGRVTLRFWQRGGGYDRNIWSDREIWEKIEYVNKNPVRRGLCQRADGWKWSSAADYAGTGSGPIPLDLDGVPRKTW